MGDHRLAQAHVPVRNVTGESHEIAGVDRTLRGFSTTL
jgi:hypothetical protein